MVRSADDQPGDARSNDLEFTAASELASAGLCIGTHLYCSGSTRAMAHGQACQGRNQSGLQHEVVAVPNAGFAVKTRNTFV